MSVATTRKTRGLEIGIDPDPPNPRDEEPITRILSFSRKYKIGDVEGYSFEDFSSWDEVEEQLYKDFDIAVCAPLYMYEHGTIGLSTDNSKYPYNDRFDAGQLGYIFITKDALRKEFGIKHITQKYISKAWKILDAEVEAYSNYLSGLIFYYVLTDHGKIIDSLTGIYANELEKTLREQIPEEYQDLIDDALEELNYL